MTLEPLRLFFLEVLRPRGGSPVLLELPYGAHARTSTCKIIASVACNILASPHPKGGHPKKGGACESVRLSPCVLVQPDGWARGEREGYGGPRGVTSLSLSLARSTRIYTC